MRVHISSSFMMRVSDISPFPSEKADRAGVHVLDNLCWPVVIFECIAVLYAYTN